MLTLTGFEQFFEFFRSSCAVESGSSASAGVPWLVKFLYGGGLISDLQIRVIEYLRRSAET